VFTWQDKLGQKYSDLPGVWKLNDFLVVKTNDGEVVMKVREHCFAGPWKNSPLKVVNTDVAGTPLTTYGETHYHNISAQKNG